MARSLILTSHHGSWLESRMPKLSGQFARILPIECPPESAAALEELGPDLTLDPS